MRKTRGFPGAISVVTIDTFDSSPFRCRLQKTCFPGEKISTHGDTGMSEGKIRIGDVCLFTKVNLYLPAQYSAVYTSLKNYHEYHLIFFFVQGLTG